MTAESWFKWKVEALILLKVYPSARNLDLRALNGRQCRWRREVAKKLNFKLKGKNNA